MSPAVLLIVASEPAVAVAVIVTDAPVAIEAWRESTPTVGPIVQVIEALPLPSGRLVGALTEAGVSKEDAPLYAEGVRRGGTLVSAKVADADRARLDALLTQSSVNLQERSAAWTKSGWTGYDPASKPYDADQVRQERDLYVGR